MVFLSQKLWFNVTVIKYFAKAGALSYTRKGVAYKLSDYVAWCNHKNRSPVSIKEIDFTVDIASRMKKILNLR